jgi:periplasmic protein TonB
MDPRRFFAATGALAINVLAGSALLGLSGTATVRDTRIEPVAARLIEPPAPVPPPAVVVPPASAPTPPVRAEPAPRPVARPEPARPVPQTARIPVEAPAAASTTEPTPPAPLPAPATPAVAVAAAAPSTMATSASVAAPVATAPPLPAGGPPGHAAAVAPASAAAASDAPRRSGPRIDASWSGNAAPPYPAAARRLGEQGEVRLDVHVGVDGSVLDVQLRTSSGSPSLDRSAMDTVRRWRFKPATVDGQAVSEWYRDWKWVFKLEG